MNKKSLRKRVTDDQSVPRYNLAPNFTWGAATSAGQIEGATTSDGRGESIWDRYFRTHPKLDNGDIACDHYYRMPQDVLLMKQLGLQAYRFSTSWSRVLPDGNGRVNEAGLDFYDRLLDNLLANEIEPYLTLYHWDLPQSLEDKGGWLNRDIGKYFAEYAELMVHRFGDRVHKWTTFNEPEVIVAGYIGQSIAPGLNDPTTGHQVGHNLLVAHGRAMQAMRSVTPALDIGMVLNLVPVDPLDEAATIAAKDRWDINYGWYLDGLLTASYPQALLAAKDRGPLVIECGDMELISQKLDYLGINYYLRLVVNKLGETCPVPNAKVTQMGWEIHPQSLSKMLIELNGKYRLPPIYITENGAALDDTIINGQIHDSGRIDYLHGHLLALADATTAGVDVRGYFAWSLMDNLEWSEGFKRTFGLTYVDRQTLDRTIKDSGLWYRDVILANSGASPRQRTRVF
jgi:beta-glucosidase